MGEIVFKFLKWHPLSHWLTRSGIELLGQLKATITEQQWGDMTWLKGRQKYKKAKRQKRQKCDMSSHPPCWLVGTSIQLFFAITLSCHRLSSRGRKTRVSWRIWTSGSFSARPEGFFCTTEIHHHKTCLNAQISRCSGNFPDGLM